MTVCVCVDNPQSWLLGCRLKADVRGLRWCGVVWGFGYCGLFSRYAGVDLRAQASVSTILLSVVQPSNTG